MKKAKVVTKRYKFWLHMLYLLLAAFSLNSSYISYELGQEIASLDDQINWVAKHSGSTVAIQIEDSEGSGVIIGNDLVLTACHVVLDGVLNPAVRILTSDDFKLRRIAEVVSYDEVKDLALLRVAVPFRPDQVAEIGEWCNYDDPIGTIGNGYNISRSLATTGYLSDYDNKQMPGYWTGSIFIVPGNSGGPIYNLKTGKVIGICAIGWPGTYIMAFPGIPLIKTFLREARDAEVYS